VTERCSNRVEWQDLIVEEELERDLRTLVKQLNAGWSNERHGDADRCAIDWAAWHE
jgi:hypothetical protein